MCSGLSSRPQLSIKVKSNSVLNTTVHGGVEEIQVVKRGTKSNNAYDHVSLLR
jgi:hypothetical protein